MKRQVTESIKMGLTSNATSSDLSRRNVAHTDQEQISILSSCADSGLKRRSANSEETGDSPRRRNMRKKQKPGPVCPSSLNPEGPYRGGRACLTFRGWTVCPDRGGRACLTFRGWTVCPEVLGVPGSGRCFLSLLCAGGSCIPLISSPRAERGYQIGQDPFSLALGDKRDVM